MKKVFSIFCLLFFLLAALEVNACGIENTFNDEYDTYTASVCVSVPNPAHSVVHFDFSFACADVFSNDFFGNISGTTVYCPYSEKPETFPPPLNILFLIWII